jgi:hypothetical protein
MAIATAGAALAVADMYPGANFREFVPAAEWGSNLAAILGNTSTFLRPKPAIVVVAAALTAAVMRATSLTPAYALAIGAAVQIAATAFSTWVARNGFDGRYVAGPLFVLLSVALIELATPSLRWIQNAAGGDAAAGFGCLAAVALATIIFGLPSPARARTAVARATVGMAPAAERIGCTHLIGDYWQVWTAVFFDRMQHGEPHLHGITHRSDALRGQWTAMRPEDRVYCAACDDPQLDLMREMNRIGPLERQSMAGSVCTYREAMLR